MRKYLATALFLIIPFAPLVVSWWHKKNGGECSLDKRQEEDV